MRGFHIGMVVVAIVTCLAAYLLGPEPCRAPIAGFLAAAALLTVAPPFPLFAHRVLADTPPLAMCPARALWLAWQATERRSPAAPRRAAVPCSHSHSLCPKPTAALALAVVSQPPAPVGAVGATARRSLWAVAGGAVVVGAAFFVAYRDSIGALWDSVVTYHQDARDTPAVTDTTHELLTFLNWRTPFAWLVVAGLIAASRSSGDDGSGPRVGTLALGGAVCRLSRLPPAAPRQPPPAPAGSAAVPAGIALGGTRARRRSRGAWERSPSRWRPAISSSSAASSSMTSRRNRSSSPPQRSREGHGRDDFVVSDHPSSRFSPTAG